MKWLHPIFLFLKFLLVEWDLKSTRWGLCCFPAMRHNADTPIMQTRAETCIHYILFIYGLPMNVWPFIVLYHHGTVRSSCTMDEDTACPTTGNTLLDFVWFWIHLHRFADDAWTIYLCIDSNCKLVSRVSSLFVSKAARVSMTLVRHVCHFERRLHHVPSLSPPVPSVENQHKFDRSMPTKSKICMRAGKTYHPTRCVTLCQHLAQSSDPIQCSAVAISG